MLSRPLHVSPCHNCMYLRGKRVIRNSWTSAFGICWNACEVRTAGVVAVLALAMAAQAQQVVPGTTAPVQAQPLAAPQAMPSINAVQQVQGQNPFAGSIPQGKATPGAIPLTLLDALNRGLQYNLGLVTATHTEAAVRAERLRALSQLLPTLSAGVTESLQQINLAAFGIPPVRGTPPVVGPFGIFDARVAGAGAVLDFSLLNNLRASNQDVSAAGSSYRNARELVVSAVGIGYLQALSATARVQAVQVQLNTAQTLYKQAVDLKNAGVTPAIDVLRAQVEMQAQQQRLLVATNDLQKGKLQLARIIGLPVGQEFTLATEVPYTPPPPLIFEESLASAYANRSDYAVAQARVRAAEFTRNAAVSERLPGVHVTADYGVLGTRPTSSHGTFTAAAGLQIPIFTGGRIRADIEAAQAALRQRQAEADDLRGRIEFEVRTAYLDLKAASDQVEVARSTLDLAQQTLTQAQDRFRAGVTNNIEVVQAQESVASSNEAFISSTLQFNLAKLELARSVGIAEQSVRQYLGGK